MTAARTLICDVAGEQWVDLLDGTTVPFTPPPAPSPFWVTVQVGGNDARGLSKATLYDMVASKLGRDLGGRMKFFGGSNGTLQDSVDNRTSTGSTEPHPVLCFKSFTTANVNSHLATVSAPESWVWQQEFYSGTLAGWSDYNSSIASLKALKDAHPNGHFVEIQGVTSMSDYRKTPGHFTDVDEMSLDSWGADSYNAKSPPYTPQQLFDPQLDAWNTMKANNPNLKFVCSEWGVSRYKTTTTLFTGPERVSYAQAQIDYAREIGMSGLTFWATDNTNEGSVLHDNSIDKGTAADDYFAAFLAEMLTEYPLT